MEGEAITSKDGEMDFATPDEGETIDINISPEELAQFLRDAEQNDVGQYVDSKLDDLQDQLDDEEVEVDLSQLADLTDDEELGLMLMTMMKRSNFQMILKESKEWLQKHSM